MKDKIRKIFTSSLAVLTVVGTSPMIVVSADAKKYEYDGAADFDYSEIKYHGSSNNHSLPRYYETDKNLSNPKLKEDRFVRLQAPGMELDSTDVNKHWECNDIDDDGAGNIIWDPATATLTLDNVDFGKLSYRHDQVDNHANATLDIAAVNPNDTVTIVIKCKNVFKPILDEAKKKDIIDRLGKDYVSEQVMISANCNIVIKAGDENASLDVESYSMSRGEEASKYHAIQAWDPDTGAFHNLTIESGTLNLKAFKSGNAIVAASVTVNGGTVNATSLEDTAITARNGKITINGGTVVAKAASGKPAMYARTININDAGTTPEIGIVLGDDMRSIGNKPLVTKLISDGDAGTYHYDTVFVPETTVGPLEDTTTALSDVTVEYHPILELNGSDDSLDVKQDGSDKVLTGDNLLDSEGAAGSKVADIKKDFEEAAEGFEIIVVNNEGTKLSDTDSVGTGSKIELVKNDVVFDTIVVVVKGDVDGDGKIDVSDAVNMLNAISGVRGSFTGVYEQASHVIGDPVLTVADVVKVLNINTKVNA